MLPILALVLMLTGLPETDATDLRHVGAGIEAEPRTTAAHQTTAASQTTTALQATAALQTTAALQAAALQTEAAPRVPAYGQVGNAAANAAQIDGPWPGFRQNVGRTGLSRQSGPLYPVNAWDYDLGGSTYSSPAVGEDGTVYIGSADSVYAIGLDGLRRWAAPIGGYAISSPAIGADGTIYVGSRDHRLYALRERDGSPKWAPFVSGDEIWSSPAIGADGTIYIGSFDGNLYALDSSTGTPIWAVAIGSEIVSSPAIGADETIYVGALDGNLYAIDRNGSLRWSFSTGGDIVSSPSVGTNGIIYVGSFDGNLYAVRPDGSKIWTTPFPTNDRIVSSPAVAADGTVYVGSLDGNLYAVHRDGSSRWTFEADGPIISSPAVDVQGSIYVGSFGGQLYAIKPDGTPRWTRSLPGGIWSSPAIGDERRLYIASTDRARFTGELHAIHSVAFQADFRTDPVEGIAQTLDVTRPEDFSPTSGRLFYRSGGGETFRPPVPLRAVGDGFEGDIPAEDVTQRGLEYYVELTNGRTIATYPPVDPQNRPASRSVRIAESATAPLDLPSSRYAMISVPLVLDDPSVQSVLMDDYGPYVPAIWRLFRWEGDEYREYPAMAADFSPGAAFFVNVRDGDPFDVEDGESVDLSAPFRITLQPGWNQVANPFAFPVSMSSFAGDTDAVGATAYWNGSEMCQEASCTDVWQPWEGYFVLNTSAGATSLLIHPVDAGITDRTAGKYAGHAATRTGPRLRLIARLTGSRLQDSQNWIGFTASADRDDAITIVEAPPFGEHVRLSVRDKAARYAGSFQPMNPEGGRWDLEVSRTSDESSRIDVSLIEEVPLPDRFEVYVLDRDRNEIIPLADGRFTIDAERGTGMRRLTVLIGTHAFAQATIEDIPDRPFAFSLDQNYPNPFNPETIIRYEVAHSGHVNLAVFDVTGRQVRTLVARVQEAGQHAATWDGLTGSGDPAASGVYFYRISSGSSNLTKKMLLLR